MVPRFLAWFLMATLLMFWVVPGKADAAWTAADSRIPHYDHVIVVVEENRSADTIFAAASQTPTFHALAQDYGVATAMYAETHPSEPNYLALIGGDTFGIRDDDAWYCLPHSTRSFCSHARAPDYVAHSINGPSLATQLAAHDLDWRAYLEDLPTPGSLDIISGATANEPAGLYAAKHNPFVNFRSVRDDPQRARHLRSFASLNRDIAAGALPAFTLIIPNICNDMHGMHMGRNVPPDCMTTAGLLRRGDVSIARIVSALMRASVWTDPHTNTALILTWDEDDGATRGIVGCCVHAPNDAANAGDGAIPTVVITNHGPRHVSDATPYDHYSLLRTIEDALGIHEHLRHADDPQVLPMTALFFRRTAPR